MVGAAWGLVVPMFFAALVYLRAGARTCQIRVRDLLHSAFDGLLLPGLVLLAIALCIQSVTRPGWAGVIATAVGGGLAYVTSFLLWAAPFGGEDTGGQDVGRTSNTRAHGLQARPPLAMASWVSPWNSGPCMTKSLILSIVIPTHNRRDALIRRTLPAIFEQDFPLDEYEVIVVVDGSTDGTLEALRGLETRLRGSRRSWSSPIADRAWRAMLPWRRRGATWCSF